jgi:hypothetical protein
MSSGVDSADAGAADDGVGLARGAANQDPGLFAGERGGDAAVDLFGGCLAEFGVPGLAVGGGGFVREEIVESFQVRLAAQVVVILLRPGRWWELAEKGSQPQGFAGNGVFFDRQGDTEAGVGWAVPALSRCWCFVITSRLVWE